MANFGEFQVQTFVLIDKRLTRATPFIKKINSFKIIMLSH